MRPAVADDTQSHGAFSVQNALGQSGQLQTDLQQVHRYRVYYPGWYGGGYDYRPYRSYYAPYYYGYTPYYSSYGGYGPYYNYGYYPYRSYYGGPRVGVSTPWFSFGW